MKNKFQIIVFFLCSHTLCLAENITIKSKNISLDKKTETSIFEDEVEIITEDGYEIKSKYLKYDKKKGILNLKDKIIGVDKKNNIIKADNAIYNENTLFFKVLVPQKL